MTAGIGSRVLELRRAHTTRKIFAPLAGLTERELSDFEAGKLRLSPEKAKDVYATALILDAALATHPTVGRVDSVETAEAVVKWYTAKLSAATERLRELSVRVDAMPLAAMSATPADATPEEAAQIIIGNFDAVADEIRELRKLVAEAGDVFGDLGSRALNERSGFDALRAKLAAAASAAERITQLKELARNPTFTAMLKLHGVGTRDDVKRAPDAILS